MAHSTWSSATRRPPPHTHTHTLHTLTGAGAVHGTAPGAQLHQRAQQRPPSAAALPQLPHTQGAQVGVGRGKGGRGGTPGPLTSRSLNPKLSQVPSELLCEEALRCSMSVPSHNINLVIHWIHTMCSSHYFAGTCTSVPCRSATCSAVAGRSSSTPCWRHVVQTSSCLM